MFLLAFIFLAMTGAALCPLAPLGRMLRHALIDAPALWLSNAGPLRLVCGALAVGVLVSMAFGAPEMLALFAFGDLTLYLEIMTVAWLLGAGTRIRTVAAAAVRLARWTVSRPAVLQSRNRAPSSPVVRPRKPSRKADPEPGRGYAFA